jgi:hypothetical protein
METAAHERFANVSRSSLAGPTLLKEKAPAETGAKVNERSPTANQRLDTGQCGAYA